jgi:hypothetical protein
MMILSGTFVRDIARRTAAREIAELRRPGIMWCLTHGQEYIPPTREEIDELLAKPEVLDAYLAGRAQDYYEEDEA